MKPVRFNATYDAGVSKIRCFFTIVERFVVGQLKRMAAKAILLIFCKSSGRFQGGWAQLVSLWPQART